MVEKNSLETLKKMSISAKIRGVSEEQKKKFSKNWIGKTHSEKTKLLMSIAHRGKKLSKETKLKLSKPKSLETRLKMSKPKSEETKLKMSIAAKNRRYKQDLKVSL